MRSFWQFLWHVLGQGPWAVRLVSFGWLGYLMSACSPLAYTVDRDLLKDIKLEHKMLLFDAENDVAITEDESEQLHKQLKDLARAINDAKKQLDSAEIEAQKAEARDDTEGVEIAEFAAQVFETKIDYLEEMQSLLQDKLAAQEEFVLLALAKYELAKARLIESYKAPGAEGLDLEEFQEQADDAGEIAKERQKELAEVAKDVETMRTQWLAERDKLEKMSGGGWGSPWAEESALWGIE